MSHGSCYVRCGSAGCKWQIALVGLSESELERPEREVEIVTPGNLQRLSPIPSRIPWSWLRASRFALETTLPTTNLSRRCSRANGPALCAPKRPHW
jgi:hypothetical protein